MFSFYICIFWGKGGGGADMSSLYARYKRNILFSCDGYMVILSYISVSK